MYSNTLYITLVGLIVYDVSSRVLTIGKLHEALESESGQFTVPELEVELDMDAGFYAYFNKYIKSSDLRVNIIYRNGSEVLTFFDGYVQNPELDYDPGTETAKIRASHVLSFLNTLGVELSENQDNYYAKALLFLPPNFWGGITRPNIDIDIAFYEEGRNWNVTDFFVNAPYFYNGRTYMNYFGDFLRSLGCFFYWRNDYVYIRDRAILLSGTPSAVAEGQFLAARDLVPWKRSRKNIIINSTNAKDNRNLKIASNDSDNQGADTLEITADLLATMAIRLSSGAYFNLYRFLSPVVLAGYENWYTRKAMEWTVELAGLEWYVADTVTLPSSNKWWLIEETWKDFENETTECLLVSL